MSAPSSRARRERGRRHFAPALTHGLVALAALTTAQAAPPSGPALHQALHGLWCSSHDQGRSCWAWDEFRPDGTFEACGRTDDDPRPFRGTGRFTIEGRRMCYLVTAASDNFWLPPGARYCTEIVAIDARSHRWRDLDTGAEFTLLRRPVEAKHCPD